MSAKTAETKLRCSPEEKAAWAAAAGGQRQLSTWLRKLANDEATRLAKIPGEGRSDLGAVVESDRVSPDEAERIVAGAAQEKLSPKNCPRAHFHRKGVYCGTCKKLN